MLFDEGVGIITTTTTTMSAFAAPGTHLQELIVATATTEQKIACVSCLHRWSLRRTIHYDSTPSL